MKSKILQEIHLFATNEARKRYKHPRLRSKYACTKQKIEKKEINTYTKIPVTIDVMKVPSIAKVQIAPKLEKNGFWKTGNVRQSVNYTIDHLFNKHFDDNGCPVKYPHWQTYIVSMAKNHTGCRLKPDSVKFQSRIVIMLMSKKLKPMQSYNVKHPRGRHHASHGLP